MISCDHADFRNLLDLYASRLRERFDNTILSQIWTERNSRMSRYSEDSAFQRRLDNADKLRFEEAWGQLDGKLSSTHLKSFVTGLTARTPGKHTVESDFSYLKQVKNCQRVSLSNYAMEGQM